MKTINERTTEYPIDDIFLKRYSPRAMSGVSLSKEKLMTLFEAARWAPSASNAQPWKFVYAMRDTPKFEKLFSLLVDFNKSWCTKASALILVISKNTLPDGKPSVSHSFDAGSAWENFALQATHMGLVCHGMAGFYYPMAKKEFNIPDDYSVEIMIVVGEHGKIEDLPEPLREREVPSDRKPLAEIVFEGKFPDKI